MPIVTAPRAEHHRDAFGIGEAAPRLSWTVTAASAGWEQTGYEISVERSGSSERFTKTGTDQILVAWPDAPLASRESAIVRVRVHGSNGESSPWSDPTSIETGLLQATDWSARPVGAPWTEDRDSDERRPSLVRRTFDARSGLVRARLYASAHGLYEAEINGTRIGDDVLSPGWTVYRERLRYYTYDVTPLISVGANAIGAWLGDGWYRGRLGWRDAFRNIFGEDLSFFGQLELEYSDGSVQTIATDSSWTAAPSPILRTGIYDGEDYDARLEPTGWSTPDYDAAHWVPVAVHKRDPATLTAPTAPPVRCTQEVEPVAVLTSPSGSRILDFGQNLVGRVRIRVQGAAGTTVTLRTAEVLQDGELYTRPLRGARSTDNYTLAGRDSPEEWEPRFTFHGFRYVEVTGWPGDLDAAADAGDLVARVHHTDLERTGWFECSDPLVNRLHENIVWGMRGNFVDIPTDCPQRDERVGWTGDLQVFAPTASYLYDVSGMLSGWLTDVAVEQLPDGTVPWYVPVIPAHHMWTPIKPGAAWGDVATLTPWALYERFGDVEILRRQYDSARRWVDLVTRLAGPDRLWDDGFQLGDWLDPAAPPQNPAAARTDKYLVASAYFARSAHTLARIAEALDLTDDATHYRRLAEEVRAAFATRYIDANGIMTSDAQTAYALSIMFELHDSDEQRDAAGNRLAQLVREAGNRIATGFVGTPLVSDALTRTGHLDTAYDLLQERECPSWLYQVEMGATTVWERWDAMLPDGSVNSGTMTSFNHYALGAVADWMHRVVAGLRTEEPGLRRIRFAPRPGGGMTHASATHTTPYGVASIHWRIADGDLTVTMTVPVGATGVLDVPGLPEEELRHGTHERVVTLEDAGRVVHVAH